MGTADLAAIVFRALLSAPALELRGVVTQPDRPKGRDLKLVPTAVKVAALERGLPVLQPEKARDPNFLPQLAALQPDVIVVAAYGQILPQTLLDLPPLGCVNVHTSLLPKYRGAAPIQWAMLNGEAETGVTIMKMDAGCDTGPILAVERTPILPEDDGQSLHDRLANLGAALLLRTIPEYAAGRIQPQPQPAEGASHARKITKEDGRIDWTRPALEIWNRVRGLHPWPGAFTTISGALLKIHRAEVVGNASGIPGTLLTADSQGIVVACGEGALRVLVLQREGGKALAAADFLRGHRLPPGLRLGQTL